MLSSFLYLYIIFYTNYCYYKKKRIIKDYFKYRIGYILRGCFELGYLNQGIF